MSNTGQGTPEKKRTLTLKVFLSIITGVTILMFLTVLFVLSPGNNPAGHGKADVLNRLRSITQIDSSPAFKVKTLFTSSIISINNKDNQLSIYNPRHSPGFTIHFKIVNSTLSMDDASQNNFDDLVTDSLHLDGYQHWLQQKTLAADSIKKDLKKAASAIGCEYTAAEFDGVKDIRSALLNLIYYAVANTNGIMEITPSGKLKHINESVVPFDIIDTLKFSAAIDSLSKNASNDAQRFIDEQYAKTHKSAFPMTESGQTDQQMADVFLGKGTIVFNSKPAFLFLNEVKYILYVNREPFPYDSQSGAPSDSVKAKVMLKANFAISGQKAPDISQLETQAGITQQNNGGGNKRSWTDLFKDIVIQMHSNAGPFVLVNNRLENPGNRVSSVKYGQSTGLHSLLVELKDNQAAHPAMTVIKKSTLIYLFFFTLLFFLVINLFFKRLVNKFLPAPVALVVVENKTEDDTTNKQVSEAVLAEEPGAKAVVQTDTAPGTEVVSELISVPETDQALLELEAERKSLASELKKISALFVGFNADETTVYEYLRSKIILVENTKTIPGIKKFLACFNSSESLKSERWEQLFKRYEKTDQAINEFTDVLKSKKKIKEQFLTDAFYADSSIWLANKIIEIHCPQEQIADTDFERIKRNQIKLVLLNHFLEIAETTGSETNQEMLQKRIDSANRKIDEYNLHVTDNLLLPLINDNEPVFAAMSRVLENLISDVQAGRDINKFKELFVGPVSGDLYSYLKKKIKSTEDDGKAPALIAFATSFKSANQTAYRSKKDILAELDINSGIVEEFLTGLKGIKGTDLFARNALIYASLKLGERLTQVNKYPLPECFRMETIKDDQVQLILFKYFISTLQKGRYTSKDFENNILIANKRIQENNQLLSQEVSLPEIDYRGIVSSESSSAFLLLNDAIGKMGMFKEYETVKDFFERMDKFFIAGLSSKIRDLRFSLDGLNPDDQAWFFERLFNITFHVTDFADHFLKSDDINYHDNYRLLLNNLDFSQIEYREFVENDFKKSDPGSNVVAKAARAAGVKKLNFLINNFYIKPT